MRRGVVLVLLSLLLFPTIVGAKEAASWEQERMYFIMVDRFVDGNPDNNAQVDKDDPKAFHGGDIRGVIEKLDYIESLGFTSVWLTPVFENMPDGYHGYWIKDFYNIDPQFGTKEDLQELVDEAHKRDMKVILDFVVNHVGPKHPWVEERPDWFHDELPIVLWNDQEQVETHWLFDLPDFKTEDPEVKDYLLEAATYWIEETGIDGYRLDTVRHVDKPFWEDFVKAVRAVDPDFYLLAEVFDPDPQYVAEYDDLGFNSITNFTFYDRVSKTMTQKSASVDEIDVAASYAETFFNDPNQMATFLDNHDVERFMHVAELGGAESAERRLRLGLFALYASPGMPIVFQGTENAQKGGADPANRAMIDFPGNEELHEYVTMMNRMREEYPVFATGEQRMIASKDGMAVFERRDGDDVALYAINMNAEDREIEFEVSEVGEDTRLRGLLFSQLVTDKRGTFTIKLAGESANAYIVEESEVNMWTIGLLVIAIPIFLTGLVMWKRRKSAS